MNPTIINNTKHGIPPENSSNYQTLKSTFVMGISSTANIILGIVRHKVIALLLGSSGMGLLGVYQSISNLALNISGLGINESGARQVAIAFRSEDVKVISGTSLALKRTALITGIVGASIFLLLSPRISLLTFKNTENAFDIALLSLTILFGTISGGQLALIQGARKIPYIAKINVLGPLWGTLISLPIIYFLGMRGIVSYLIIMSLTNIITTWWFSRKIEIPPIKASWQSSMLEAKSLVGLGTALMIGTIIAVGAGYLVRILIIRSLGLAAAGQFQASAIFSSVYVGILLKAMATDFYPRLSAASDDDQKSGLLVNEQIEAGLLLAAPGVLLTLTFAPLLMTIFYSSEFLPAVEVLKWQVLGVLIQIVTWPMGYVLRAKAAGGLIIVTELYSYSCYLAATWIGMKIVGLPGIGMAYFTYNALYLILMYGILRSKYHFYLSGKNIRILTLTFTIVAAALLATYFLPEHYIAINIILTLASISYAYKKLNLSQWLSKFVNFFKNKK